MDAIFAGSFDPFTLGHREIVERGLKVFDRIIVGVADDTGKNTAPLASRVFMAKSSLLGLKRVEVTEFFGMTTDFCKSKCVSVLLRGIRSEKDFEYEKGLLQIYKQMGEVELVYLFSDLPHISSSAVRQMVTGGISPKEYVDKQILPLVMQLYASNR